MRRRSGFHTFDRWLYNATVAGDPPRTDLVLGVDLDGFLWARRRRGGARAYVVALKGIIADELQFPPAVFLAARLASLKADRDVDIILASNSPRELDRAGQFAGPFQLLDISGLQSDLDLPPTSYFTRATYLSLFVPALLLKKYDRLLYLDVDTYPESARVFDLLDLDLGGHLLAAIRDLNIPFYGSDFNRDELTTTLRIPVEAQQDRRQRRR